MPEPTREVRESAIAVHATHCCPIHGCKYSDDDCPVQLHDIAPTYPKNNGCERCEADEGEAHQGLNQYWVGYNAALEDLGRLVERERSVGCSITNHRVVGWVETVRAKFGLPR